MTIPANPMGSNPLLFVEEHGKTHFVHDTYRHYFAAQKLEQVLVVAALQRNLNISGYTPPLSCSRSELDFIYHRNTNPDEGLSNILFMLDNNYETRYVLPFLETVGSDSAIAKAIFKRVWHGFAFNDEMFPTFKVPDDGDLMADCFVKEAALRAINPSEILMMYCADIDDITKVAAVAYGLSDRSIIWKQDKAIKFLSYARPDVLEDFLNKEQVRVKIERDEKKELYTAYLSDDGTTVYFHIEPSLPRPHYFAAGLIKNFDRESNTAVLKTDSGVEFADGFSIMDWMTILIDHNDAKYCTCEISGENPSELYQLVTSILEQSCEKVIATFSTSRMLPSSNMQQLDLISKIVAQTKTRYR